MKHTIKTILLAQDLIFLNKFFFVLDYKHDLMNTDTTYSINKDK